MVFRLPELASNDPRVPVDSSSPPGSIIIESVTPEIDGGGHAVKREVGDWLEVTADIFKDGHDKIAAFLRYRKREEPHWRSAPMVQGDNDRWSGRVQLTKNARYVYTVEAIVDRFATWQDELQKKADAGLDVTSELMEGRAILEEVLERADGESTHQLRALISLIATSPDQESLSRTMLQPEVAALVAPFRSRDGATRYCRELPLIVDRIRARYATWYELFPRSSGTIEGQSATFDDVIALLPQISAAGFDVLYFPPIHPIGETNRKGANNSLHSLPADPGCPYAIGSSAGGHDAIEPSLGTMADFHRLVEAASGFDIELALDLAIQAAPDHSWARDHPEWFFIRPDRSIKYAENPPKKYEDIYPINFASSAWRELWAEIRRIVLFWIDQGVTIFRVDNPHTKPTPFWEWLISSVQAIHPETIFLAEAFTRPKVMQSLAKAGFSQSYTYFTWRNFKQELIDYFTELTTPPVSDYMRGNLFTNTPDILPTVLQDGPRAAFKMRLTLAATLSSVYGIYSGFELCEGRPLPGREEYLDSEKYQHKVWDWNRPGNIREYVTLVNQIRREHPALQEYDNLRFFWSDHDDILCYGKALPEAHDYLLVVVNLDPWHVHETMIHFDPAFFGVQGDDTYRSVDLLTGQSWIWKGGTHYVRLDPEVEPAHIFHLVSGEIEESRGS